MDISISPERVKQLYFIATEKAIDVIMYEDIIQIQDLKKLFKNNNAVIIFYPCVKIDNITNGHFTSLIKNDVDKVYYYYDSLAYKPDEYKKFSPMRNKLYRENQNSLIKHFMTNNYNVDYNNKQTQSRSSNIATCGYHSVLRCVYANLSNDEYNKVLSNMNKKLKLDKNKFFDNVVYNLFSRIIV